MITDKPAREEIILTQRTKLWCKRTNIAVYAVIFIVMPLILYTAARIFVGEFPADLLIEIMVTNLILMLIFYRSRLAARIFDRWFTIEFYRDRVKIKSFLYKQEFFYADVKHMELKSNNAWTENAARSSAWRMDIETDNKKISLYTAAGIHEPEKDKCSLCILKSAISIRSLFPTIKTADDKKSKHLSFYRRKFKYSPSRIKYAAVILMSILSVVMFNLAAASDTDLSLDMSAVLKVMIAVYFVSLPFAGISLSGSTECGIDFHESFILISSKRGVRHIDYMDIVQCVCCVTTASPYLRISFVNGKMVEYKLAKDKKETAVAAAKELTLRMHEYRYLYGSSYATTIGSEMYGYYRTI